MEPGSLFVFRRPGCGILLRSRQKCDITAVGRNDNIFIFSMEDSL